MYKKDIINFLFVSTFPVYGIGTYISSAVTPTVGFLICLTPFFLIVLFHLVDLLYKREFRTRVNGNYWLALLFILSGVWSILVAFDKHLPEFPIHLMLIKVLFLLVPFHAFVIVSVYNDDGDRVVKLLFKSFGVLLVINIIGYYGLGMRNLLHAIEGRLNFPFLDGLYGVAGLLAVMNLMIFYFLRKSLNKPITMFYLVAYFLLNLFILFYINSRLCMLVFLIVIAVMAFNVMRRFTWIFIVSLFTLPIIINGSLLIYKILSLPFFSSLLQRVDRADVVTFNGRFFLWDTVFQWLEYDREGLLFGNGYKGHYFLDLLGGLDKMFDLKALYTLHLHSVPLEILVSQGVLGLVLFFLILYRTFVHCRVAYQRGSTEGALFPVVMFMIFIIHVDSNGYLNNSGGLILSFLMAQAAVKLSPTPVRLNAEGSSVGKTYVWNLKQVAE